MSAAGPKYLKQSTVKGIYAEEQGVDASGGAPDAAKIVVTNSAGKVDRTFLDDVEVLNLQATEDIAAGAVVHIFLSGGVAKVRNADASAVNAGKMALAFAPSAIANGASGDVYFSGEITGLTSLTIGAFYYLSDATPGAITATAPTTATHLVQKVGVALSATVLQFLPDRNPVIAG